MRWKRIHLFIISTICFCCAYYAINEKYDPFYRVNGINNDNRALILQYLDEEEQAYLTENAISMSSFEKYIASPNFYLPNYTYYQLIDNAKIYQNIDQVVDCTNELITRLNAASITSLQSFCKTLIQNDFVEVFLDNDVFVLQYIDYYKEVRSLYSNGDDKYIEDTNLYISSMQFSGLSSSQILNQLRVLCNNYDEESLLLLMTFPVEQNVTKIFNPSKLGVVIDETTFIGSYRPKELVVTNDIPRLKYTMYLQTDAYNALLQMYQDLVDESGPGLVLTQAYASYKMIVADSLELDVLPGYNEYQLATTIKVRQSGVNPSEFNTTESYQWLKENAHLYGYILRYPGHDDVAEQSNIFRYVGEELATTLYEQQLTLEQYQEMNQ